MVNCGGGHIGPPLQHLAAAAALLFIAVACGGSGYGGSSQTATTMTAPTARPRPTSGASSPVATEHGGLVEVTGVVGAINRADRRIDITRLSGANVTVIDVQPTTTIRQAMGGRGTLDEIRPSDRIIASGRLTDRGDALIAGEITVQQVVAPPPGG